MVFITVFCGKSKPIALPSCSIIITTIKTGIIRGGAASYFTSILTIFFVFLRKMYFVFFWLILYRIFEVLFIFSVDKSLILLQFLGEYSVIYES